MITNAGRAVITARLYGVAAAAFCAIGIGTGTNAPANTDTALQTGVTASGSADGGVHAIPTASTTPSSQTTTVANDTAQWQGTVTASGAIAVTEAGLFNADSAGTMLCRQTFSAVNLASGDSLQITFKVKNA